MSEELRKLIEAARSHEMSAEERAAQSLSFAYGNGGIDDSTIDRQAVMEAAKQKAETRSKR